MVPKKSGESGAMARYRVVVRHTSTEVVDAENEYMAAVIVADRLGNGAEIADVQRANGRTGSNGNGNGHGSANGNGTTTKKKRRPLTPEARANLAANLVKARAARAAKARARKRATKTTKKTAKRTSKQR